MNKFDEKDEVISHFIKLGLKLDINLHSSIIYQFPSMDSKKYKSYEFPTIEETFLQEKSISKYEIPQYIQDIPEGFSLFCTLWEASKVKQYMLLSQEEQEKLNIKENYDKIEKDNNINFNEPIPKNNYCYICQEKFEDYLIHIESLKHKNNYKKYNNNSFLGKNVKNTFKRINKFWNKSNNNNTETEDYNSVSSSSNAQEEENEESDISNENNNKIKEDKEDKEDNENKSIKSPLDSLFSSYNVNNNININNISIKNNNEINLNDNKENIVENNFGNEFKFNIIDNKKKEGKYFLKKKRITFEVIRCEKYYGGNNRDYFCFLNKFKTKKLIRNINVLFK